MNNRKNIESILEQSKQNKGGFKLPEGYFDQLQQDVSAKVQNKQEAKVVALPKGPGRSFAALLIAASFAMIFILVQPSFQTAQSSDVTFSFSEYSTDEINGYLEENTDEYDLIAFVETADFEIINESSELSNLEDKSLSDFLIDESVDFDLNEIYSN